MEDECGWLSEGRLAPVPIHPKEKAVASARVVDLLTNQRDVRSLLSEMPGGRCSHDAATYNGHVGFRFNVVLRPRSKLEGVCIWVIPQRHVQGNEETGTRLSRPIERL